MDVNEERSIHPQSKVNIAASKDDKKGLEELLYEEVNIFGTGWNVYIATLSPFYGYNPGSYVMTDVKDIEVTDNFHNLPTRKKMCMADVYEECLSRNLLTKGRQNYGCTPLGLSLAAKHEMVSSQAHSTSQNQVRKSE